MTTQTLNTANLCKRCGGFSELLSLCFDCEDQIIQDGIAEIQAMTGFDHRPARSSMSSILTLDIGLMMRPNHRFWGSENVG